MNILDLTIANEMNKDWNANSYGNNEHKTLKGHLNKLHVIAA